MGSPRAGMLDLLKLLGGFLAGLFRSPAAREAEMAFLRQQLLVLKRSAPARLQLRTTDGSVSFRACSEQHFPAAEQSVQAASGIPSAMAVRRM